MPPPEILEFGGEAVWRFFVDLLALWNELVRRGCLWNVVVMASVECGVMASGCGDRYCGWLFACIAGGCDCYLYIYVFALQRSLAGL